MKAPEIIYQVDAFTNVPFKGNPAGVCILGKEPPEKWMQNIAMEMNLSETAFVYPGVNARQIRFYTPQAEVPLCGHATLSASHIIFENGHAKPDEEITLLSKAGELRVSKKENWIRMNFPAYSVNKISVPDEIEQLIGIRPVELYKSMFGWSLALLPDEKSVRELRPDFSLMKNSEYGDMIVTAVSDDPAFDFCVRCFAPLLGIDEDPVTGSAHCALVPFWHTKSGKHDFISHQISKRSGVLKVSLKSDRVEISGEALTIMKAELYV